MTDPGVGGDAAGERQEQARLRLQASEYRRLSSSEEAVLVGRRPEAAAVERLVEHNLDVVVEQADAHTDEGVAWSDLYQEGTVGLLDAIAVYAGQGDFRESLGLHVGLQMDALIEGERLARKEEAQLLEDCKVLDMATVRLSGAEGKTPPDTQLMRALEWDRERYERASSALRVARERNDELTLQYIDEEILEALDEPEADGDPYRRLPGHGPDD